MTPAAKLARESCSAKPTTMPATPKPARSGVISSPSWNSATSKPTIIMSVPVTDCTVRLRRRDAWTLEASRSFQTRLLANLASNRNASRIRRKIRILNTRRGACVVSHVFVLWARLLRRPPSTAGFRSPVVIWPVALKSSSLYSAVSMSSDSIIWMVAFRLITRRSKSARSSLSRALSSALFWFALIRSHRPSMLERSSSILPASNMPRVSRWVSMNFLSLAVGMSSRSIT